MGVCWKVVKGGGCVVGRVDDVGELTGIRIAYIYPDWHTALRGEMKEERLVKAKRCVVPAISSVRTTTFTGTAFKPNEFWANSTQT